MADNDKTIANLARLAIGQAFNITDYKDDLYLVSHPLNRLSSTPSDYITYNINLIDLAELILSATYDELFNKVSTELSLGELAHQNQLETSKQAGLQIINLDENVDPSTYGMLALPTPKLKHLSTVPDISSNLGFRDLAFKAEEELELSALAHKDYITSADVSAGAKFPSAQIDVPFRNLCLSDESMLSLSTLAHQDVVYPNQVVDGLSIQQLCTNGAGGWKPVFDNHYLSIATKTTRGSIAVGYVDNNAPNRRLYGVKLSGDHAYVNVPWTNTFYSVSCSLSASPLSNNTLVFTQKRQFVSDNTSGNISTTSSNITLTPYIENNITGTGTGSLVSPRIALFVGDKILSSGATLSVDNTKMFYRADGTFQHIQSVSRSISGMMQPSDYAYLYDLTSNLPLATSSLRGAIKVGFNANGTKIPLQLLNEQAYVDLPIATSANYGMIKVGASVSNGRIPVKKDTSGNAYVEVNTNANDILASILSQLYPVGAIYITAANVTTCPLEGIGGLHWTQITGKYLLASGTLVGNETYSPGASVTAGLPSHTHKFSFGFSAASSTTGYPHHGNGSKCNHGSFEFDTKGPSNSIYGASSTVRPQAYAVAVFQRVL